LPSFSSKILMFLFLFWNGGFTPNLCIQTQLFYYIIQQNLTREIQRLTRSRHPSNIATPTDEGGIMNRVSAQHHTNTHHLNNRMNHQTDHWRERSTTGLANHQRTPVHAVEVATSVFREPIPKRDQCIDLAMSDQTMPSPTRVHHPTFVAMTLLHHAI
jgi:hypothetical protein